MSAARDARQLHGVMAEFDSEESLLRAIREARGEGYTHMEAYAPYPVAGLTEALGRKHTKLPVVIFFGGITGAVTAYVMQWFSAVYDYPINVGGRPLHSWPMFIPVTFELTILFSALTAVVAMLLLNGLPRLNHPVFNVEQFLRASQDRLFLVIESTDPAFSPDKVSDFLRTLAPLSVAEVNAE